MDEDHPDHAQADVAGGYVPDYSNIWEDQADLDPSETYVPEEGELEEEVQIAASAVYMYSEVGEKRPRETKSKSPPQWTHQELLEWNKAQEGEPAPPSQTWIEGSGGGYPQEAYQVTQQSDAVLGLRYVPAPAGKGRQTAAPRVVEVLETF